MYIESLKYYLIAGTDPSPIDFPIKIAHAEEKPIGIMYATRPILLIIV